MEHKDVIETIGSITKMENLQSLEEDILENTLVLRNIDPFPGYHASAGQTENSIKPVSVFIILRYRYAPEKINKLNKELIQNRYTRCYPSFGEIITRDSIYPCIRLKGIDNSGQIPSIQDYFVKNDIQLMSFRKIESPGRIKIFKTFRLMELNDGLYRDLNDGEKFYIRTPQPLNWKRFEYISRKIRYNLKNPNFDSALGVIYRFCGPEDVIRIYDHDKSTERALELKKLYTKEIKSDMLIWADMSQFES